MSYRDFYERLLGRQLPPGGPEISTQCLHHQDQHNSMSLNLDTGLWFCHAHNVGGNAQKAYELVHGVSKAEAKKAIEQEDFPDTPEREKQESPPVGQDIVDEYIRGLNQSPDARTDAHRNFGWSDATLKKFEIGWHANLGRYMIPVRDDSGQVRNIRMYDPNSSGIKKMISWRKGYGHARLFPISALDAKQVFIVEGEKDCILLNQVLSENKVADSAAITGTGGAGTWRDEWNDRFKGKDVVFVYDIDKAGKENAAKIAAVLVKIANSVKVVTLDITEPPKADVTDYFVHSAKGWDDLNKLIEETEFYTPQTKRKRSVTVKDTTTYSPHLSQASEQDYIHKKLRMKVIVAGKDLAPYAVPKKVIFDCDMNAGAICKSCSMMTQNGLIEHEFDREDANLINMIKVTEPERDIFIRKLRGVATKCRLVEQEIESYYNIEETTFVPEIDFSDSDREYVSRTAYVMEHGVQTNQSYVAQGTSVPHPKTQHVVHFVPTITPAQDNIDDFTMDDQKLDVLRIFQPGSGQGVGEKMNEIAADLSTNITRIYGREDLIKAIDLVYHTVLGFDFQEKPVAKAWGDILILGDTRTGKTETLQAMIRHYKLGELALGENMSFAGLVGGLRQEAGKRWSITWGKIPLNDRRLLAIDETSGLPLETISALSGIRSNGLAEMTKIVSQKTMARTRLIFLSNPRADRMMSDYGHGVDAVKDLIGRPEDIARFDLVVSAAIDEVPISLINAHHQTHVPHVYTSDLCRSLVLWAWSRKSDNIKFVGDAEEACLDLAVEQSEKYSARVIPLIEGGNHRIKLAKLAVAAACRQFSTDNGEDVLVTTDHVQYAAAFLDECYGKPSLDYAGQSELANRRERIPQASKDEVARWMTKNPEWAEFWMENDAVRLEDIKTQFDIETKEARSDIFKPLAKWKMIERSKSTTAYIKTPAFIRILKGYEKPSVVLHGAPDPAPDEPDTQDDLPF